MQIQVIKVRDSLTPSVRRRLNRWRDPKPVLAAMGAVVVSLAMRAFTDASLRPSSWAPLSPRTIRGRLKDNRGTAPLQRTGLLARSPRVTTLTSHSVIVGSDRAYAGYQQLGTSRIPARPFFPFDRSGRPTPRARALMMFAADRAIGLRD
ncbi:phage virion morphogenesis protein [Prosthecobacter sp.]|jgi:phage gpG-like protein|uniref:phage virion morphogenesis protein n=1 Tax=Prosthecobacter sp. TaxID=1965333 RepID=UPI0037C92E04